ncbi:hypothetical protein M2436_000047 [Streptomyces sp. HB372]|nr:hypothetical protein [Streptomyces sp. HB372]
MLPHHVDEGGPADDSPLALLLRAFPEERPRPATPLITDEHWYRAAAKHDAVCQGRPGAPEE